MVSAVQAPVKEIGAAAGDHLAAAHVHGDTHHAVGGHAAGRRDHCGDLRRPWLGVEVGVAAGLTVKLGVVVVGVRCAAKEDREWRV